MRLPFRVITIGALLLGCQYTFATPLSDYANMCDAEIGFTVPQIDCDAGTVVPTTINGTAVEVVPASDPRSPSATLIKRSANGTFDQPLACDRPNVLRIGVSGCDPMSRFQVVVNNPEAYVVAHCRQKGGIPSSYGDIAIIQHNKTTGASCFYQSSVDSKTTTVNKIIPSPKSAPANPIVGASGVCWSCHDNGPLIRTPYLTQIRTGLNVIPGFQSWNFNKDQPYFSVQNPGTVDRYHIKISGNQCTTCHALSGFRNAGTTGPLSLNSAGHLALKATGDQLDKLGAGRTNPGTISTTSPMWMSLLGPNLTGGFFNWSASAPNNTQFSQSSYDAAVAIQNCANNFGTANPLPAGCTVTKAPAKRVVPRSIVGATKCIDLNFDDFNGNFSPARIQTWNCYAQQANQLWTIDDQGKIKSGNNKCLSVPNTAIVNGLTVNAETCDTTNTNNRQKWTYNAYTGRITNRHVDINAPSSLKCLDLDGNTLNLNGGKVQMWDCLNNNNQKFALQELQDTFLRNLAQDATNQSANFALNVQAGSLTLSASQANWWSAQWTIERSGDVYRIRNKWKENEFINYENFNLKSSTIDTSWESTKWILRNRPEKSAEKGVEVYTIQNAWDQSKYLVFRNGVLTVGTYDPNTNDNTAFWSFNVTL